MADRFEMGSIPPISVWGNETVTFSVARHTGYADFIMDVKPVPQGKISISKELGEFSYTPAPEDDELTVTLQAGEGRLDKQTFHITVQPRLESDFHVIEHVSEEPRTDSQFYLSFSEQDAGKKVFNNTTDSPVEIETKQITVAGVKLVIEQSSAVDSLYKKLNGRPNLRRLTLCADEIVIRTELKLPGTAVAIYARVLHFEGSGQINTTPLSVEMRPFKGSVDDAGKIKERPGRDSGINGQDAGSVYLMAREMKVPNTGTIVFARGGNGQPAREGIRGKDGNSYAVWDGRFWAAAGMGFGVGDWLDVSRDIARMWNEYKPVSAEIYEIQGLAAPKKVTSIINAARNDSGDAKKSVPTSGTAPFVLPGAPGRGGNGGNVICTHRYKIEGRFEIQAGEDGAKAANVEAAKKGTPDKWVVVKVIYHPQVKSPDFEMGGVSLLDINMGRETQDGPPGIAPGAFGRAQNGRNLLHDEDITWAWVHPAAARAFISYARDVMLSGHTKGLKELLTLYRDALTSALSSASYAYSGITTESADRMAAVTLEAELTSLINRLDGPYDYFGNPAGWVPMLSFQANMELFTKEIETAIRVLFLAHWVESTENRNRQSADVLSKTCDRLREESAKALADYKVAEGKIGDIENRARQLAADLEKCALDLATTEADLRSKLKDQLQLEHKLRASGKILGGVMQLIPVGQPVAGAFGKSLTALSDIDLDNPKASASKIASPLAKVAGQGLKNKASKLYEKLSTAKKKEEDEKTKAFNAEFAKKENEDAVKTYRDEQKDAKDQIIEAFSGFAVSEEDIDERLEKVLADTPGYKAIIEKVKELNKKKATVTEELLSVLDTIDAAAMTVMKNQLALINLRGQTDVKLEALNPDALQYVRAMGQRARDRLMLYQYYLVKSYHYLMIEDLPVIDYRSQNLIKALTKMLTDSPDGTLTDAQFDALKAVFTAQLSEVAKEILEYYQTHPVKLKGSQPISLTKAQIETLNAEGQVEIELFNWLNAQREDIRIANIETDKVTLAAPLPRTTTGFSLEYRHDGISRIRRGGQLYVFRSGQYRIASGKGEPTPDQYRNDRVFWATDIKYDPRPSSGKDIDKIKITETTISRAEKNLVRELIRDPRNQGDKDPLLSFEPSAWTRLRITRSGEYEGKIAELTLTLNHLFHGIADRLKTVIVRTDDEIQPLIRCQPRDVNKSGDGYGSLVRTYDKATTGDVTVRAPARYGQRGFVGWRIGTEMTESGEKAPPIHTNPVLTLDLKKNAYVIEPVYEALEFVPTNAENEAWPPCPVGWKFNDWVLVNSSTATINISWLAWLPLHPSFPDGITPTVNEPQGSEHIKLSFDKLMLTPGESAKVSVCTNPGAPDNAEIGFGFRLGDILYVIFPNAQFASLGMTRKRTIGSRTSGWSGTGQMFDADMWNRTLTFKGSG